MNLEQVWRMRWAAEQYHAALDALGLRTRQAEDALALFYAELERLEDELPVAPPESRPGGVGPEN